MTHPDPQDLLRPLLHARVRTASPTPECLDDDTIATLADGTLGAAERAAVLPHLAGCPHCRAAVASVARALSDPLVAQELAALPGAGRRRFLRYALPAAAAAILLLLAGPWLPNDGRPPHRAPPGTGTQSPVPLAPVGVVAEATTLRWAAVAGSDRYRVTLFDAGARVLYETQVVDTVVALPDSIALAPGQSYLWKVEARTGWDRWVASGLFEFSIAGGAPP